MPLNLPVEPATNTYRPSPQWAGINYQAFPKVDLHRHLEGSLRLSTLMEVGRSHGMNLPGTASLREKVQVIDGQALSIQNFLSKFDTLRTFYRSPQVINRVAREAVADAAADNVRYLELRFTPVALSRAQQFPLAEVMDWVIESVRSAEAEFGVRTRLIASVNRHEGPEVAARVVALAADRACSGIVGLDLAGNEATFPGDEFAALFNEARQAGLRLTVHAGEWGGARNVWQAIALLGAERIGHGVRVLEDPETIELARACSVTFEVCLTSNYQTGVIPTLSTHPLPRMIAKGLNVTLNSDDPSISQIRLSDEYRLACENLGLSLDNLRDSVLNAARAAFLPAAERLQLLAELSQEFQHN